MGAEKGVKVESREEGGTGEERESGRMRKGKRKKVRRKKGGRGEGEETMNDLSWCQDRRNTEFRQKITLDDLANYRRSQVKHTSVLIHCLNTLYNCSFEALSAGTVRYFNNGFSIGKIH